MHFNILVSNFYFPFIVHIPISDVAACLSTFCYFQGIPMAPLWASGKGKFVGVLSALDFILIMKEVAALNFT